MAAPRFVIELLLSSTHRFASEDIYINDILYQRALLNEPSVAKELSDIYYGITPPHTINIELSNADGTLSSLAAGEELRGKSVILKRYDIEADAVDYGEDGYGGEGYGGSTSPVFQLRGKITEYDIREKAILSVAVQDPDVFQTLLPQKLYETDDWTESPPDVVNPPQDLGKPYSLCFGHCKKVPLRYVHADYTNDYYDYLIGPGPIESNNSNKTTAVNVYRNKVLVDSTEYYVHGGETTIQYTDSNFGMTAGNANPYQKDGISYAFIRFKKEQRDFQGNLYELTADLRGLKLGGTSAERNFVKVLQHILSDTSWGLGLGVVAGSFDSEATEVNDLYCDGHISEQRRAADIRDELLYACRGSLEEDENGSWTITVDKYQSWDDGHFGFKDGYWENIIEIIRHGKTPIREAIKNYTLRYGKDPWTGEFKYQNTRSVFTFGEDRVVEANFIHDHTTADKITCYIQKRLQEADRKLSIRVGTEGRNLTQGNVVKINIPDSIYNISNQRFRIVRIEKGIKDFLLELEGYSSAIYDYTAGTLPSDAGSDNEPDYSNTPPSAPTNLTKTSQGTYQGTDGTTLAYFELTADAPSANFSHMLFAYRKAGEAVFTYTEGEDQGSGTWGARIDGLVPGMNYDIAAVSVNAFNLRSSLTTLTNQVAPGDTTRPAQVTGVVGKGKYKTWHFAWNKNSETDLRGYHVQIATDSGFTNIVHDKIIDANSVSYTDDSLGYGTLYCRVKAVDYTGNESSSWSSTASATTSETDTVDIKDNAITVPAYSFSPGRSLVLDYLGWWTFQTVTLTTHGQPVFIFLSLNIAAGGSGERFDLRVLRDNTEIYYGEDVIEGGISYFPFSFNLGDTPPAGTHTYKFEVYFDVRTGFSYNHTSLLVLECRT